MKRMLVTISLLAVSAITLFGQARVCFNNFELGSWIYAGPLIGPPSEWTYAGSDYSIQLLWVPGTYSDQAAFEAANPRSSASVAFFGVTGPAPAHGPTADGAGAFDGSVVYFGNYYAEYTGQARAWFNNGQFATFAEALAAGAKVGMSQLFRIRGDAPPGPCPNSVFPSFTIWQIPEPSALVLLGLGATSLLFLRRFNKSLC